VNVVFAVNFSKMEIIKIYYSGLLIIASRDCNFVGKFLEFESGDCLLPA